jgi:hypothetical protein
LAQNSEFETSVESSKGASVIRAMLVVLIGSAVMVGGAYATMSVFSGPDGWASKAAATVMPNAYYAAAEQ